MERDRIIKLTAALHKAIRLEIEKKRYNDALELVFACAMLPYNTNMYYVDDALEESIQAVAEALFSAQIPRVERGELKQDTILFYDGFGLDRRGLARIYLEALVQDYKVCYVTFADREQEVPEILQTVQASGGTVSFLRKARPVEMIRQLNAILHACRAGKIFFYAYPYDIIAPVLMQAYEGVLTRYVVNLTDHAYWLGARAIDKCIEFRDYGASISSEYRGIPREKIVKLPFYPKIVPQEFQGFPFPVKDGQRVVFSGGSLYKTFGEGNKYLSLIHI